MSERVPKQNSSVNLVGGCCERCRRFRSPKDSFRLDKKFICKACVSELERQKDLDFEVASAELHGDAA